MIRGNQDGNWGKKLVWLFNSQVKDLKEGRKCIIWEWRCKGHSWLLLIVLNHLSKLGKCVISWENIGEILWGIFLTKASEKSWQIPLYVKYGFQTHGCQCLNKTVVFCLSQPPPLPLCLFILSNSLSASPSLWLYRIVKGECEEVTYLPQCFHSLLTKLPSEKNSTLFICIAPPGFGKSTELFLWVL